MDADLVVLGGGAAGIGAARAARRRGASVTIVEEGRIGGDCTFTGCVPSKSLLAAAARGETFDSAMREVHRAIEVVAARENTSAMRSEGIDVLQGRACFLNRRTLDVDGRSVHADAIVIATGASPAVSRIPGIDDVAYLTNETLFTHWARCPGRWRCWEPVPSAWRWPRPLAASVPKSRSSRRQLRCFPGKSRWSPGSSPTRWPTSGSPCVQPSGCPMGWQGNRSSIHVSNAPAWRS
jgi:cation diffusion facilitator CzcD-associated flavoprotein CzcO